MKSIKAAALPVPEPLPLEELLGSWMLHLRAERKSPQTLKVYGDGVRAYLRWCDEQGLPAVIDRAAVATFVGDLLDAGIAPATARSRHLSLKRFALWLVAEGELDSDPLVGLAPPKLDERLVPVLSDDQLAALIAACNGKELRHRRDEAIVRFMIETGCRAGEIVAMKADDVDLARGVAAVTGKGGRSRLVPFGPATGRALDRYLRLRRAHRLADLPALWLTPRGAMTYAGLHSELKIRAREAGIDRFHPHRLRHTAAHRWLAAGGTEGGLMAVAGWRTRTMLHRYAASAAMRACPGRGPPPRPRGPALIAVRTTPGRPRRGARSRPVDVECTWASAPLESAAPYLDDLGIDVRARPPRRRPLSGSGASCMWPDPLATD